MTCKINATHPPSLFINTTLLQSPTPTPPPPNPPYPPPPSPSIAAATR